MSSDFHIQTVGIVGLGLIGASFAKAFRENSNYKILGYDIDSSINHFAVLDGTLDAILTEDRISECDFLLLAMYPKAIISYLKEHAGKIKKTALVMDCGGTKQDICRECQAVAHEYGFTFVGGHPMAGKKYSGYKYSSGKLFKNASMVIVPEHTDDISFLDHIKQVLAPCEFGRITVCSAEKHDEMIAFTSQMAHLVSNAYIKSPTAKEHKGFSAGSYKDMTRVAWLNETMWTELFLENKDNLVKELDYIIGFLSEYRNALANENAEELWRLLHEGKICKEEVDGK